MEWRKQREARRLIILFYFRSLSSILLVQNKKWSPDLIGIFTEEKLIEIYDDQAKRFQTGRYKKRKVVGADIIADIVKVYSSC